MDRLGTTLNQVLVGTVGDEHDPESIRDAVVDAGIPSEDVVVLEGRAGLEELLGHDRNRGILGRLAQLVRYIEMLDSSGTGHVLGTAEADLRAGRSVVMVRHVDSATAGWMSDLLRANGVDHQHYVGRWTVAEHGIVPSFGA